MLPFGGAPAPPDGSYVFVGGGLCCGGPTGTVAETYAERFILSGGTYQAVHEDGVKLYRSNGSVHFTGNVAGGGFRWISFKSSCGGGWYIASGTEFIWDGTDLVMGTRFASRTYRRE